MIKSTRDRAPPKTIIRLVTELGHRHSPWQVFTDFVEMAAISISNAVDLQQRAAREARYLEVVRRYSPTEVPLFPEMLASLVLELEREPQDALGRAFHELEFHNKWSGQFFTPHHLCRMMAKMIVGNADDVKQRIETRGFLTASEPASGAGAMIIALAEELKSLGVNYQQQLHVTAVDVDAKCVHMTYLQLALLHIPAVVVHGNSLTLEEHGHWYTPAHIMGGWNFKLRKVSEVVSPGNPLESEPSRPADPGTKPSPPDKQSQLTLF